MHYFPYIYRHPHLPPPPHKYTQDGIFHCVALIFDHVQISICCLIVCHQKEFTENC